MYVDPDILLCRHLEDGVECFRDIPFYRRRIDPTDEICARFDTFPE